MNRVSPFSRTFTTVNSFVDLLHFFSRVPIDPVFVRSVSLLVCVCGTLSLRRPYHLLIGFPVTLTPGSSLLLLCCPSPTPVSLLLQIRPTPKGLVNKSYSSLESLYVTRTLAVLHSTALYSNRLSEIVDNPLWHTSLYPLRSRLRSSGQSPRTCRVYFPLPVKLVRSFSSPLLVTLHNLSSGFLNWSLRSSNHFPQTRLGDRLTLFLLILSSVKFPFVP